MTKLTFSDGETFDTSGPLRIERRRDGLYVLGEGLLCACDTREEAEELLREFKGHRDKKGGE